MIERIPVLLPGDNIVLRPLHLQDAKELFELIERNRAHLESWWDNFHPLYRNVAEVRAGVFAAALESLRYGIVREERLIGYLSFTPSICNNEVGAISYWVTAEECGKGIGTAAVGSFTRFAFEYLGIRRLYAYVRPGNMATYAVLRKNGYVLKALPSDIRFEATKS